MLTSSDYLVDSVWTLQVSRASEPNSLPPPLQMEVPHHHLSLSSFLLPAARDTHPRLHRTDCLIVHNPTTQSDAIILSKRISSYAWRRLKITLRHFARSSPLHSFLSADLGLSRFYNPNVCLLEVSQRRSLIAMGSLILLLADLHFASRHGTCYR